MNESTESGDAGSGVHKAVDGRRTLRTPGSARVAAICHVATAPAGGRNERLPGMLACVSTESYESTFETIRRVARKSVTLLLVELYARLELQTCDRNSVMESGLITQAGDAKALLVNREVRRAVLDG